MRYSGILTIDKSSVGTIRPGEDDNWDFLAAGDHASIRVQRGDVEFLLRKPYVPPPPPYTEDEKPQFVQVMVHKGGVFEVMPTFSGPVTFEVRTINSDKAAVKVEPVKEN